MNETSKKILAQKMDAIFSLIMAMPETDALWREISSVTEPGNLGAVFENMKFFLAKGSVPATSVGFSSLPAIIFGLPEMQKLLEKELDKEGIHRSEVESISKEYMNALKIIQ